MRVTCQVSIVSQAACRDRTTPKPVLLLAPVFAEHRDGTCAKHADILCVRAAAMEQATAQMDRMAVDDEDDHDDGPAADDSRRPDGGDAGTGGGKAANGPSSSAQPPDRPPSAAPSASASGSVVGSPLA